MKVSRSDQIGAVGVHAVGAIIHEQLGWIFREQPLHDCGIDAHIEVVVGGEPTGQLIAVQIKTGPSYFQERTTEGVVFRFDAEHATYWQNHRLPVVIVLYDVDAKRAYWQTAAHHTIESTGKRSKMIIPMENTLDVNAISKLADVVENQPPYQRRLAQLTLARAWMDMIVSGNTMFLEAEKWVNKSSGRTDLRLVAVDRQGREINVKVWPVGIFPGWAFEEIITDTLPWAAFSVDTELYAQHDYMQYVEECYHYPFGSEEPYIEMDYEEWTASRSDTDLRPYDFNGEVEFWRLKIDLNEIGLSFLTLDEYLRTGQQING